MNLVLRMVGDNSRPVETGSEMDRTSNDQEEIAISSKQSYSQNSLYRRTVLKSLGIAGLIGMPAQSVATAASQEDNTLFHNTFDNGLEGWEIGQRKNSDPTKGSGEWSSEYGGSIKLHVDGAPSTIQTWRSVDSLEKEDEITVQYSPSRFAYNEAGLKLFVITPEDEWVKLDEDNDQEGGNYEQDGTLKGTVSNNYPDGAEIGIHLVIWPGETTVWVEEVKAVRSGQTDTLPGTSTSPASDTLRSPTATPTTTTQHKLAAPDGVQNDLFGMGVAMSADGTTALIAAWLFDPNGEGVVSAYVFSRADGNWTQQAKLAPDDSDQGDSIVTVAMSADGTTVLISAKDEHTNGPWSAYVFSRSSGNWTQQAKFTPDDSDGRNDFGSVEISADGTTALIGAPFERDPNGEGVGSAYVFSRADGDWTQQSKLAASDYDESDYFGSDVAMSADGTTALIGVPYGDDPNGEGAGSAYVFSRSSGNWTQQAKLAPDDGDSDDGFGVSMGISADGTTALIGTLRDEDPNGGEAGSAYVFSRADGDWTQQAKLAASDGDESDSFGSPVSMSANGTTALIGAPYDDDTGPRVGSAYVFEGLPGMAGFDPEIHGFGFPNWGGETGCETGTSDCPADQQFTLELEPFGVDQVWETISSEWSVSMQRWQIELVARLVYALKVRQTVMNGHCYGMAFAAAEYFSDPSLLPDGVDTASDVPHPTGEYAAVGQRIRDIQRSQLLAAEGFWLQKSALSFGTVDTETALTELKTAIDETGTAGVAFGDLSGGHQVLAYDCAEKDGEVMVSFYDPNYPAATYPERGEFASTFGLDADTGELLYSPFQYDNWAYNDPNLDPDLVDQLVGGVDQVFDQLANAAVFRLHSPASLEVSGVDEGSVIHPTAEDAYDGVLSDAVFVIGESTSDFEVAVVGEGNGDYTLDVFAVREGETVIDEERTDSINEGAKDRFVVTTGDDGSISIQSASELQQTTTATDQQTTEAETTDGSGPGLGIVSALAGVGGLGYFLASQRDEDEVRE
ncbi:hypothetical protein BRC92_03795 [Halobacteriales archaeon QS_4_69_31]|nr:MAG: hypothetical protein BRC92_03795 [Halobacteriales archaeon QS_4_69_31]